MCDCDDHDPIRWGKNEHPDCPNVHYRCRYCAEMILELLPPDETGYNEEKEDVPRVGVRRPLKMGWHGT